MGFRLCWRCESKSLDGGPKLSADIRTLCYISLASLLWGASRILGELIKLGIDIDQTKSPIGCYVIRWHKYDFSLRE
jgi:hypothetical protein